MLCWKWQWCLGDFFFFFFFFFEIPGGLRSIVSVSPHHCMHLVTHVRPHQLLLASCWQAVNNQNGLMRLTDQPLDAHFPHAAHLFSMARLTPLYIDERGQEPSPTHNRHRKRFSRYSTRGLSSNWAKPETLLVSTKVLRRRNRMIFETQACSVSQVGLVVSRLGSARTF
ncbi:uncharacterized protein EI97DRAFT_151717 [Westerdykella ornata]|uniref:Uncharacterized protein n=1 Tax=Westerdykella ornata TaxID=318751 RepID=A0A6A6JAV2_WESOR|nr:uncharacterized protein EI97DRAFT_151717 [Westerdykella ornata]KAF2273740.1 hypothetical protein EI97DRAFT_151717 [Westerdykella ornata]